MLKHLFSIDLVPAYYLFWVCCFLLGILLLFSVVNLIDYPSDSKQTIFLLTYAAGFFSFLTMGVRIYVLALRMPYFLHLDRPQNFHGISLRSLVGTGFHPLFHDPNALDLPEAAISLSLSLAHASSYLVLPIGTGVCCYL